MSTRSTRAACAAVLPVSLLFASAVGAVNAPAANVAAALQAPTAPAQQSQNVQMVTFAAGVHALAEACGANTPAEVAKMKADGRTAFLGRGVDAATYDKTYKAGYEAGKRRLAAASAEERAKGCAQLKAMPKSPTKP